MKTQMKRGDVVYLEYGCMHGNDFGTVLGQEKTQWGVITWIRKSNFELDSVTTLMGMVTGRVVTDCEGAEFFSARGTKGIGAYLVVPSV